MQEITNHLRSCAYKDEVLPRWYSAYLKSKEQELEKDEFAEQKLDEELRDKLNREKNLPLSQRLFKPGDAIQNRQLGKMVGIKP